jgi:hypothetical protein
MKLRNQLTIVLCLSLALFTFSCKQQEQKTESSTASSSDASGFKGDIKLDVRDSKADWGPYIRKKAPEGAPNILFILYDDTGLAAWSPYGGRIEMPTMDKLAQRG